MASDTQQRFVDRALRRKKLFLALSIVGIVIAVVLAAYFGFRRLNDPTFPIGPRAVIIVLDPPELAPKPPPIPLRIVHRRLQETRTRGSDPLMRRHYWIWAFLAGIDPQARVRRIPHAVGPGGCSTSRTRENSASGWQGCDPESTILRSKSCAVRVRRKVDVPSPRS